MQEEGLLSQEEVKVVLKKLHSAQQQILSEAGRFNSLVCGRRFGKTELAKDLIINPMLDGYPVAYFAPIYKDLDNVWEETKHTLKDIIEHKDEQLKQIKIITGGLVDMWSLEDPDSGRGRKYKRVVIDEAEKAKKLKEAWERNIRGLLTDYQGDAWFMSTPKFGQTYFKTVLCENYKKYPDWRKWKFTSYDNPFLPIGEIDEIKAQLADIVFRCEYLAEDVSIKDNLWAFCFDRTKHLGKCEPNPGEYLYLSFDFNRNPISCVVIQHYDNQVNVVESISLNNSNIYELCDYILVKYPDYAYIITGDATGQASSALVRDAINYYTVIKDKLGLTQNHFRVPTVNPKLSENQVLVNSILEHYKVVIDTDKAQTLIYDMENVRMTPDGKIEKENRQDEAQKADKIDCFRYWCNMFMNDFLRSIKVIE